VTTRRLGVHLLACQSWWRRGTEGSPDRVVGVLYVRDVLQTVEDVAPGEVSKGSKWRRRFGAWLGVACPKRQGSLARL
jgi:hypothetical protein